MSSDPGYDFDDFGSIVLGDNCWTDANRRDTIEKSGHRFIVPIDSLRL